MSKDIQVGKANDSDLNMLAGLHNMDRFVDRFFSDPFAPFFSPMASPFLSNMALPVQARTEVRETDSAYVLSAEVPGIPKENIEIEVSGNILLIRAENRSKTEENGESRRTFQSFQQSFSLPTTVDADHLEAHCENGVLEVLIPKKASAQAKKISVQSGKGSIWSRLEGKKPEAAAAKNVN